MIDLNQHNKIEPRVRPVFLGAFAFISFIIGAWPVGILFVILALWMARKKPADNPHKGSHTNAIATPAASPKPILASTVGTNKRTLAYTIVGLIILIAIGSLSYTTHYYYQASTKLQSQLDISDSDLSQIQSQIDQVKSDLDTANSSNSALQNRVIDLEAQLSNNRVSYNTPKPVATPSAPPGVQVGLTIAQLNAQIACLSILTAPGSAADPTSSSRYATCKAATLNAK